ncbi:hypothetical protein E8E13_007355 [Curvularia kusanoi]|uniref:Uncharacterized protein n=1 Tax=Curvularia kusanoi TaxID=90978 RepID=A0A9P4W9G9_CURKU|nr:hypothetical protein E8E13_007355 [Curvularia kusanoi]
MSGIEIAGLVIGVLPLLVELVKSYSTISRRAHVLRHYGKTVKSLSTQLETQNGLFMNEIRLLLLCVEEENVVEEMLADDNNERWTNDELGKKLHRVLGDNYLICRNIIEEIKDMIEELRKDLKQFDIFWDRKLKGESINDLSTLRLQMNALQEYPATTKQYTAVPKNYGSIQVAARKLHEALCEAWCCDDAAHRSHYAKLCLEAHVQSEVQLDLAISCHEPDDTSLASSAYPPPIWLHVQSTSTSSTKSDRHIQHNTISVLKKKPSSELQQTSGSRKRTKLAKVVGYLESPQMYKHRFYFQENDLHIQRNVSELHSIFDVMRYDAEDALDIVDQIKLAHRASKAILQYNNTPWLDSRWRLRDLKYFGLKDLLDEDALKTLHVSSQLSSPKDNSTTRCHMEDVQETQDSVSYEVRYGINNMSLFFLGVALLEIAHWKPIEDQMTPKDLNDQVFAARRIASQPSHMGPVYHRIARKCLQGNFGAEPDLGQKSLQTAVYNDVVCELESMIKKLEI